MTSFNERRTIGPLQDRVTRPCQCFLINYHKNSCVSNIGLKIDNLANFIMLLSFLGTILYYHLFLWLTWSWDPVGQRAYYANQANISDNICPPIAAQYSQRIAWSYMLYNGLFLQNNYYFLAAIRSRSWRSQCLAMIELSYVNPLKETCNSNSIVQLVMQFSWETGWRDCCLKQEVPV